MDSPKTRFHSVLEQKIEQRRRDLMESIGAGVCQDFPAYKYNVGVLAGMEQALAICADVEREF